MTTPIQRRLVLVADAAAQEPTDPGYLHAVLCQLGLPRRRTDATKGPSPNNSFNVPACWKSATI